MPTVVKNPYFYFPLRFVQIDFYGEVRFRISALHYIFLISLAVRSDRLLRRSPFPYIRPPLHYGLTFWIFMWVETG